MRKRAKGKLTFAISDMIASLSCQMYLSPCIIAETVNSHELSSVISTHLFAIILLTLFPTCPITSRPAPPLTVQHSIRPGSHLHLSGASPESSPTAGISSHLRYPRCVPLPGHLRYPGRARPVPLQVPVPHQVPWMYAPPQPPQVPRAGVGTQGHHC